MKRAKLLSLFLAGSLLFQTAGIDAMATALSEPAPISESVEGIEDDFSEQLAEEENGSTESTEENDSGQFSDDEEENETPDGEEATPEQPSESETPDGEEIIPEQPSDGETEGEDVDVEDETPDLPVEGEEEDPGLSSEEENEDKVPVEEEVGSEDSVSENTVCENTVSENTVSENTLPEYEANLFSIFPGLGDDYKFSSKQLADKRVLASHVKDVVRIQSVETATIADYQDTEGEYEPDEVVYLAETKDEAEQVAAAFGGTLDSYSYEVAVISLPKQATVALAVAAAAEPDIKLPAVWPNYYNYLYADTNATVNPMKPNDPGFEEQWHHDYIGTRYAWAAGYKGEGVKVAVIDTGLDQNHEDLRENALSGKNFADGADGTEQTTDNHSHGTHVAGIIAADENDKGGIGIAPEANVRGYTVFNRNSRCETSWIMSAINAAVLDGNDIINMSLGSPNYHGGYEEVITKAYEKGVAIFASAGNDDSDGNNFPAAYASTISVGAIDENSARASFSNYGKTVTLSFPGVGIYSTVPSNGYDYMSGTSQASPAAAGTAAVILSARKDIFSKSGKSRVDALLSAMKSSTTKCVNSGMGAGTTYLPGVLKLATDMSAPETPVIEVSSEANYRINGNNYIEKGIEVTLSTKTAVGVDIYYAIDGKTPTYKNGEVINAENKEPYKIGDKIELTGAKSKTIKAIAVNPFSGKVSKVASKTVKLTPIPDKVTVDPVNNVKRVAAGKSLKFTATVSPAYAISNKVAWAVDKKAEEAGITVINGTVKTKPTTVPGEYTVTATAMGSDLKNFNGESGSFKFNVIATSTITKIAFVDPTTGTAPKPVSLSIKKDDTLEMAKYLVVTKTDPKTKEKTELKGELALGEVVWFSGNTKVATVSNQGVITAKGPGKATIKAISDDGGNKSATYNVTVLQPVTKITISGPDKVAAGKGVALVAQVKPANASNKKVAWSIDGDGKVRINAANGKITTTKDAAGTYTVTATAVDELGAAPATYAITIVDEEISKIDLNERKLTLFPPNTSATQNTRVALKATVTGKKNGAVQTLTNPLITWYSSAPSVASVDSDGNVIAKAPGKATITCAATDGSNKKATCAVTVSVPMSKLVIGPTDGNAGFVAVGKKIKMVAKYYSNYGTPANKKIKWDIIEYGNPILRDKVRIDKNGMVSVDKALSLPSTGAYVSVQATAEDNSGVTSNAHEIYIYPCFIAARLEKIATVDEENLVNGYHFIVEATAVKDGSGKPDWSKAVMLPSFYCTATVSGPKNVGLYKDSLLVGESPNGYDIALYDPQPLKATTKQLDDLPPNGNVQLFTNECDKITLTVKLKDGSNLKAKVTRYAVQYRNKAKYYVIGYYE